MKLPSDDNVVVSRSDRVLLNRLPCCCFVTPENKFAKLAIPDDALFPVDFGGDN